LFFFEVVAEAGETPLYPEQIVALALDGLGRERLGRFSRLNKDLLTSYMRPGWGEVGKDFKIK
jgi:hypothetical protein